MIARADEHTFTRKHIFVVNGDPAFLELVRELLQLEEFNVTTTNFVPRTFAQIGALNPDLLVIDLVIGEQDGWELLERVKYEAVTRDIPVIVTSTDPHLLEIAQQNEGRYGHNRYITKPLDIDELLKTVEELVGRA